MKLPVGYVAGEGVLKPTGYGGYGERMLRHMGWDKGQGLGKAGQGMKEAIEVKKKEDTVGVGGNARWNWDDKWWERAFDSAVQTVDDDSDSSDSDDDIDAAKIQAAIGGTSSVLNRDGTATTASHEELKLMKALSQGGRLAAGRFGGRDGKMERIRAQEAKMAAEAAAKLGVSSMSGKPSSARGAGTSYRSDTTSDAALPMPKKEAKSEDSSKKRKRKDKERSEDADEEVSGKSKRKEKKERSKSKTKSAEAGALAASDENEEENATGPEGEAQQPSGKRARIVIEPRGYDSVPKWDFKPTPRAGWWGASMFISAGCLDSMKKDIKASERAEFTEANQEKLYHDAHAGKTQGKIGLGQRSGPVKIGGVKWSGKKVSFEEDAAVQGEAEGEGPGNEDEEDDDRGENDASEGEIAARKAALHAVGSSTGLADLNLGGEDSEAAVRAVLPEWAADIKWKKVVIRALEAAPGKELKLKALRSAVTAAVTAKLGPGTNIGKAEVQVQVESTITSSSKFVVEGKRVKLKV